MAISRAQMLKELLPGLNALFGLEYEKYEDEHEMIYETESSDRSFEEEVKLSLALVLHLLKLKARLLATTQHRNLSLLVTTTKQSQWASLLLRKQWKITCMTLCLLVTPKLLLALWHTPSRLKRRIHLTMASLTSYSLVMVLTCSLFW
jgi:hypothetical protein